MRQVARRGSEEQSSQAWSLPSKSLQKGRGGDVGDTHDSSLNVVSPKRAKALVQDAFTEHLLCARPRTRGKGKYRKG